MIQAYYCQEKLDHSSGFILSHMVQSTVILKLFFMISLPSRIITLLDWKEIILSCHFSLLTTWWKWRGKIFDKRFLFYKVLFTDYKYVVPWFYLNPREIMPAVRKNKEQAKTNAAYNIVMGNDWNEEEMIAANRRSTDQMANIIDIR